MLSNYYFFPLYLLPILKINKIFHECFYFTKIKQFIWEFLFWMKLIFDSLWFLHFYSFCYSFCHISKIILAFLQAFISVRFEFLFLDTFSISVYFIWLFHLPSSGGILTYKVQLKSTRTEDLKVKKKKN